MYCRNCGNEVTAGYYCVNCGTFAGESVGITIAEPLSDVQRLKRAFSSKLFLTMAILASVSVGIFMLVAIMVSAYFAVLPVEYAAIVGGVLLSICALVMILPIVELVGYWKTYKCNTNSDGIDASGPKIFAAVARISYVINWIFAVIIALPGIVSICLFTSKREALTSNVYNDMEFSGVIFFISIICILIAVINIVLLLLYARKKVRLFKELAVSAETGVINITDAKTLHMWVLVMGIINAAIGLSSGITVLIPAAIEICFSFWIKENFVNNA